MANQLNKTETQTLIEVVQGLQVAADWIENGGQVRPERLRAMADKVQTVVTMKGNYPSLQD